MPSREEIASWLRYAADEILNPYRPIPKETRIAIGVQQIIDEIRNHAIQVENMRCNTCEHEIFWYSKDEHRPCSGAFSGGCFSYKAKETNHE